MTNIVSVNLHVTNVCNMQCKFCFAKYDETSSKFISADSAFKIIKSLSDYGIEKINFAGGEPLLHPMLHSFIRYASNLGLITGIISNGSLMSEQWIKDNSTYLDWIGISIDSLNRKSNHRIGRKIHNSGCISKEAYLSKTKLIKEYGVQLKVNTVVCKYNMQEDFSEFINEIKPRRWKIFQVLPIASLDNTFNGQITINNEDFNLFLTKHKSVIDKIPSFPERNQDMISSYIMIDPSGRFYSNHDKSYKYSDNIVQVGLNKALSQVTYNHKTFIDRGGMKALSRNE